MKCNKRGFTLIELLVVVLIIGILAAVAVPQYKLAVTKSRVSTILPMLKTISDAEEAYYLANGTYTEDMRDLDVDMPGNCQATGLNNRKDLLHCDNYFLFDLENKSTGAAVYAHYCPDNNTSWSACETKRDFRIDFYFRHSATNASKRKCSALYNSDLGNKICNALTLQ